MRGMNRRTLLSLALALPVAASALSRPREIESLKSYYERLGYDDPPVLLLDAQTQKLVVQKLDVPGVEEFVASVRKILKTQGLLP
jgi:hypothetical protein